jgi:hypothetical protein
MSKEIEVTMPNSPEVTTYTAIVGAITGTAGLCLSIWNSYVQAKQNEPNIKVSTNVGFISIGRYAGKNEIYLKAANHGRVTVTLSSYGFKLPDKQNMIFEANEVSGKNFPCELEPGKSCGLGRNIVSFAKSLQKRGYRGKLKIVGYFCDQVGNEYLMKKAYPFDVEGWASHSEDED